MNAFVELLQLSEHEKQARGVAFTPAEIAQQPETWRATADLFETRRQELHQFLAASGMFTFDPRERPTVFLIGAGTSDYIGQSLVMLLRREWQCEVFAVPSTDLLTHLDEIRLASKKYLWISFSRSGDSPEGVAVLQMARRQHPDIYHLIVSCNAAGKMVRDHSGDPNVLAICLHDAVNDRGLAMTSSFSNMVVFGQCLAHCGQPERYKPVLAQMIGAAQNFLPMAADCAASFAKDSCNKVCFVGSGPLRAVAKESRLKVLELTAGRVIAMSESALGLRHGPMAALDQDTLFVSFLSSNARVRAYEEKLLQEIGSKKLVASRVVISAGKLQNANADYNLTLGGGALLEDDNYRPPLDVIFGQMLGLFFSLRSGLQPDCPSQNGAISRVVQSVI